MRLERGFVGEKPVEAAVATVVVDLVFGYAEQVVESGAAEPILGDVQLARRGTEPGYDEHGRHRGPRHLLTAGREQPRQQLVETDRLPKTMREPDVAELSASFEPQAAEVERDR